MKKNWIKFKQSEFKNLSELKHSVYKTLNKNKKQITRKQLNLIFNTKTIKKSKIKKYSFLKTYKKLTTYFVNQKAVTVAQAKNIVTPFLTSARFTTEYKKIFDHPLFKNDSILKAKYKYLQKINNIIEKNDFEIFKKAKVVQINNTLYDFNQLIKPQAKINYIKKIRANLIDLDYTFIKQMSYLKNLKKLKALLLDKITNLPQHFNYLDFSKLDFSKSFNELKKEIENIDYNFKLFAGYINTRETPYFKIEEMYLSSHPSDYSLEKIELKQGAYLQLLNEYRKHQGDISFLFNDFDNYTIIQFLENLNKNIPTTTNLNRNIVRFFSDLITNLKKDI